MPDRDTIAGALDRIGRLLDSRRKGRPITASELQRAVSEEFDCPRTSVLPSDYCYNLVNRHPQSMSMPLFEHVDRGNYKYLGPGFRYTGDVWWHPIGESARRVGTWTDGVLAMEIDPRDG